ncbi:MAG: beta-lactamase family protein [Deltaproteobacteria bacterium]|nr:beta-lactamase family protein [Deltaproteobacteria bacterium]
MPPSSTDACSPGPPDIPPPRSFNALADDWKSELAAEIDEMSDDRLFRNRPIRVIIDRTFTNGGPIETMSVTNSLVSLAIGLLLDEGKLDSLDAPAHRWFPEWKTGAFAQITVGHLMTQSSGLEHGTVAEPLYRAKDALSVALGRKLRTAPGLVFSYNNEATQLLSKIVAECAQEPVDQYLDARIFRPLEFGRWTWTRDAVGNVRTFSDLALEPRDLAKIGLLFLHRGKVRDRRLISERWVTRSTRPADRFGDYGLLWWVRRPPPGVVQTPASVRRVEQLGFAEIRKLRGLDYRIFESDAAYWLAAGSRLTAEARARLSRMETRGVSPIVEMPRAPIGYYANGWLGQYLIVYPENNMVVVRLRRSTEKPMSESNEVCRRAGGDRHHSRRAPSCVVSQVAPVLGDSWPSEGGVALTSGPLARL